MAKNCMLQSFTSRVAEVLIDKTMFNALPAEAKPISVRYPSTSAAWLEAARPLCQVLRARRPWRASPSTRAFARHPRVIDRAAGARMPPCWRAD
jgi:hypothetical protein